MWLMNMPISSMWPTIATVGRSSATPTETVEEPRTSALTSPNEAASRQTSAAGVS